MVPSARSRTRDLPLTRRLLCHLSYDGLRCSRSGSLVHFGMRSGVTGRIRTDDGGVTTRRLKPLVDGHTGAHSVGPMVGAVGIEPTTGDFKGRCSTD